MPRRQRVASVFRWHHDARQVGHGDRQRPKRDEQESHALALRQAQDQEEIAEQRQRPDAAWSALEQERRQEQQKDRPELVREAVEAIGLDRERHDRKEQVERSDRQRPFGRVEHLVQARAAEEAAEKRKDGIAGMHIGSQVPPAADSDRRRDIDKCKAQPTEAARPAMPAACGQALRSAIAAASSPHRTSAGYLTPMARPANKPAMIAARSSAGRATGSRRRSPPSRTRPGPRR